MKKFLAILVVLAMTVFASAAFAADIAVSGQLDIRSRDFSNMDMNEDAADTNATKQRDTQSRVRLNIDAKGENAKGKVAIENDWDTWGRVESYQANNAGGTGPFLRLREAWIDFMLPGLPVGVKGGHQLLQLGNGWFFRSMKYGSDAWLVYAPMGNNTLAFVDVKAAEGATSSTDDMDAYVILDMLKLDDKNSVGIDVTNIKDRKANNIAPGALEANLMNIGLNYTGVLGPVNLKAEVDMQGGKIKTGGATDPKFKGNQIVIQGTIPMDAVKVNFTVARGSGQPATGNDVKEMITVLDADPHYTFMYEYKMASPACPNPLSGANQAGKGFCGTTALNVGASFAASKSLTVAADLWMLQSTEDVANTQGAGTTSDLGNEIDVKVLWKLYDNVSWNWNIGYFMPGDGMGKDAATGVQGILSYTF